MRTRLPFIILAWVLADVYFFRAVETLTNNPVILWGYWLIDMLLVAGFVSLMSRTRANRPPADLIAVLMAGTLLTFVPKVLSIPVLVIGDITRLIRHFPPRSIWVSELTMAVAAFVFISLLYGMTGGRHRYKVHRVTLKFEDLPKEFDGFTITQLSDIHAGSFTSRRGVEKGISLVNKQNSDMILFTGDLVNNKASEMEPWIELFAKLKAPFGKYSVLGNHDYGDYISWESEEAKNDNLAQLKQVHQQIGFNLLLNSAVQIKKAGAAIALIGVENWGKGGFHKYGSLTRATAGVADNEFKILMSHDPSHWEAKTLEHEKHINLALAGHTHGMQFGIELFGFQWSPIKYMYPQWAGLYSHNGKYLYVNRGFGFLGFKGRLGIWPEITVITLKKK
ncbi:metallophosphoesterase [Mucilaginibacter sp. L3T2-6]|uniref:metallophosphoesterase n=1 Tax=Mucilaginibacter sp. L3T2-6 TaxID=3062491 RepID=UPI002675FF7D|nr:metallophosphoesterase [Mucilaginibacter sp. L3T2-6]MDO3642901.1 metallophosphoesterase [Mucilaginibacter sp. L3T2-6]MDV6215226.1 metallophosphoesterase [Mucilaginibacter sp. L3T2-6]